MLMGPSLLERLAVGGWWGLAVGGWRLAVGGGWRVAAVGRCRGQGWGDFVLHMGPSLEKGQRRLVNKTNRPSIAGGRPRALRAVPSETTRNAHCLGTRQSQTAVYHCTLLRAEQCSVPEASLPTSCTETCGALVS